MSSCTLQKPASWLFLQCCLSESGFSLLSCSSCSTTCVCCLHWHQRPLDQHDAFTHLPLSPWSSVHHGQSFHREKHSLLRHPLPWLLHVPNSYLVRSFFPLLQLPCIMPHPQPSPSHILPSSSFFSFSNHHCCTALILCGVALLFCLSSSCITSYYSWRTANKKRSWLTLLCYCPFIYPNLNVFCDASYASDLCLPIFSSVLYINGGECCGRSEQLPCLQFLLRFFPIRS